MTAPPRPRQKTAPATPAAEVEALRREYEDLRLRLAEVGRRLDNLAAEARGGEDDGRARAPAGLPRQGEAKAGDGPPLGELIDALVRDVERDHSAPTAGHQPGRRGRAWRPWQRLNALVRQPGAAWVLATLSLLALVLLAVRLGL